MKNQICQLLGKPSASYLELASPQFVKSAILALPGADRSNNQASVGTSSPSEQNISNLALPGADRSNNQASVGTSSPSEQNIYNFVEELKNIITGVEYRSFWKKRAHFSLQSAPKGITQMREYLELKTDSSLIDLIMPEDILKYLSDIASDRLNETKGFAYFFTTYDKRDDKTYLLYELCKRAHENVVKKKPVMTGCQVLLNEIKKANQKNKTTRDISRNNAVN